MPSYKESRASPINDRLRNAILDGLTEEQRQAVTSSAQYLRIVAAAGTGKTETLTRRILWHLSSDPEPSHVVAFTFTERAAEALKARVYRKVQEVGLVKIVPKLGEMFIGTIHEFCFHLLQDYAGYGNHDPLTDHQEIAFVSRYGWDLGLHELKNAKGRIPYPAAVGSFLRSLAVLDNEHPRLKLDHEDARSRVFFEMASKYRQLLADHRVLTFGQMIVTVIDGLGRDESPVCRHIRSHLQHLFVDEYQDINPAQGELIKCLVAHGVALTVVGDPRQCIYQWRGSDVSCFETFGEQFRNAETVNLTENRRSLPPIVQLANQFSRTLGTEYPPMTYVRNAKYAAAWLHYQPTAPFEAQWIAQQISELKQIGFSYRGISILLRSVTTSAPDILQALDAEPSIPYKVNGRTGLFRRKEAQVLGKLFAWLGSVQWPIEVGNPWAGSRPVTDDDLSKDIMLFWKPKPKNGEVVRRLLAYIRSGVEGQEFSHLTELYQQILVALGILILDPGDPVDAARLNSFGRFNELLTDFEAMARRARVEQPGSARGRPNAALLRGLAWFIVTHAVGAYEELPEESRGESDIVTVSTVHQAKGLEWPVVFLPALTDRRFPSSKMGSSLEWLLSTSLFPVTRYEGDELDERRLFYVALTRARDGIYLSWHERKKDGGNRQVRSRFVNDLAASSSARVGIPYLESGASAGTEVRTYSPSELLLYRRCPYRFRLSQNWGFQPGLEQALGYGRSLHHVIQQLCRQVLQGKRLDEQLIQQVLKSEFFLPFAQRSTWNTLRASAEKALLTYANNQKESFSRIHELESRLEFPTGEDSMQVVTGRVDVILSDGEGVEPREYKTIDAEDASTTQDAYWQLSVYAAGLKAQGRNVSSGSVASLSTGMVRIVDTSQEAIARVLYEVRQLIKGIINEEYPARVSEHCGRCDFKALCRYYQSHKTQK